MRRMFAAISVAVVAITSLTACGSSGSSSKTITVFAAASLKEPFTQLKASFEASHPGVTIVFNFGGSPDLVQGVNSGAPADVLATASLKTMSQATSAISPKTFATNTMEIAVPLSNPARITSLRDLAKPGVRVAICAPAVPCGVVAAQVLNNAHLTVKAATNPADVKSVLALVDSNNVDAGLVYVTDVLGDSSVKGVKIPASENSVTTYPIAVLKGAGDKTLAQEFVDYVDGPTGQQLLASEGWGKP